MKNRLNRLISIFLIAIFMTGVFSIGVLSLSLNSENVNTKFITHVVQKSTMPEGYTAINSPEDLNNIRNNLEGKYILMSDIDLSSFESWIPIGSSKEESFRGVFDGNGYAVKDMKINITGNAEESVYAGLFGYAHSAEIYDLGIEDIDIQISNVKQIVFGGVSGAIFAMEVINCYVTGNVNISSVQYTYVGGISGHNGILVITGIALPSNSHIRNCYNTAKITVETASGYVGGVSGMHTGLVQNSCNEGTIHVKGSATKTRCVGGIAANAYSVSNCYNIGDIKDESLNFRRTGGLVGSSDRLAISSSYNAGKIEVQSNNDGDRVCTGGLAGHAAFLGERLQTYQYVFNRIDYMYDSLLTNSYYLNSINAPVGNPTIYKDALISIKSLSDSEMRTQKAFKGFDFENIWMMPSGGEYPVFKPNLEKFEFSEIKGKVELTHRKTVNIAEGTEIVGWITTNKRIAVVNENGEIEATGRGKAYVSVVTSDGQFEHCHVTVNYLWWQWIIKVLLFGWIWY